MLSLRMTLDQLAFLSSLFPKMTIKELIELLTDRGN